MDNRDSKLLQDNKSQGLYNQTRLVYIVEIWNPKSSDGFYQLQWILNISLYMIQKTKS